MRKITWWEQFFKCFSWDFLYMQKNVSKKKNNFILFEKRTIITEKYYKFFFIIFLYILNVSSTRLFNNSLLKKVRKRNIQSNLFWIQVYNTISGIEEPSWESCSRPMIAQENTRSILLRAEEYVVSGIHARDD